MIEVDGRTVPLGEALGEAVHPLTRSSAHKYLFVTDLEWSVIPPLMLWRFRLFRAQGRVGGLALWARVSEEIDDRLAGGVSRLAPLEWRSGERVWLIDLVAPFGGADRMVEELSKTALAGSGFRYWGVDEQGRRVVREAASA